MTTDELSARSFARVLRKLPEHPRITESLCGGNYSGVWYSSQREHMVGWFSELAGPGAYNRKGRGHDARFGYTHSQCPEALIWIGEALGERPEVVKQAVDAMKQNPHHSAQCGAIRKLIPWARIVELLDKQPGVGRKPRHRVRIHLG